MRNSKIHLSKQLIINCFIVIGLLCGCSIKAQVGDSLAPSANPDLSLTPKMDTMPPGLEVFTYAAEANRRHHTIGAKYLYHISVPGFQLGYRRMRNQRGFSADLITYLIPIDHSRYFSGTVVNQVGELKNDSFSQYPYYQKFGNWRTVSGEKLTGGPEIVAKTLVAAQFGLPFHIRLPHPDIKFLMQPSFGVSWYRYLDVTNDLTQIKETKSTFTYGAPPATLRVDEYFRLLEQKRTMVPKEKLIPYFAYEMHLEYQVFRHLSLSAGGRGVFQQNYESQAYHIPMLRAIHASLQLGLLWHLNPPAAPKPANERLMMRL